jgi:glycine/D-amino acid oxidase-like deaminating enzyme
MVQQMATHYDLVIVGKGIAGLAVLYELANSLGKNQKIAILSHKKLAPICSENSTAFVSHEAISRGHTPLGDYLLDGFEYFKTHYSMLDGVEKALQTRFFPMVDYKKEAFEKRYQEYLDEDKAILESYLITPHIYLKTLEEKIKKVFTDIDWIEDLVIDVKKSENEWQLSTLSKKQLRAKNVVLATGAMGRYFKIEADKKVPVGGHYIEFKGQDYGDKSFIISFENENVLYRHKEKSLQMSGFKVSDAECFIAPNETEIKRFYQDIKKKLEGKLKVPSLDEGEFYFGLREKPAKRWPYQREISPNLYSIGGGYKNGWTLLPLMAKELVTSLLRYHGKGLQ